jgi:hypothetical protein
MELAGIFAGASRKDRRAVSPLRQHDCSIFVDWYRDTGYVRGRKLPLVLSLKREAQRRTVDTLHSKEIHSRSAQDEIEWFRCIAGDTHPIKTA